MVNWQWKKNPIPRWRVYLRISLFALVLFVVLALMIVRTAFISRIARLGRN